jgi:hypothetical protein
MSKLSKIEQLRKDDYYFKKLPDTIRIPAIGVILEEIVKPTETATLDDLAFAVLALQEESSALYSLTESVRNLYDQARKNGALGSQVAIDALPETMGGAK